MAIFLEGGGVEALMARPLKIVWFQENDPGEILWDQFSLPELKNFLLILDREEAWYKRR